MEDFFKEKCILEKDTLSRTLMRIAHEIVEKNKDIEDIMLIGIKSRGIPLAHRLANLIFKITKINVSVSSLDITLYRDDLSAISEMPKVENKDITAPVVGKNIIIVDDVLYTGRTVRCALDAIMDLGRPKKIQLAVLVDRGHRELPIKADYVGKNIPTSKNEIIDVMLEEIDKEDKVSLRKV